MPTRPPRERSASTRSLHAQPETVQFGSSRQLAKQNAVLVSGHDDLLVHYLYL